MQQKHKYSHQFERCVIRVIRIMAFNRVRTLVGPSCVAAVGHGWVVVEISDTIRGCTHKKLR
jgi:hypothetical protein